MQSEQPGQYTEKPPPHIIHMYVYRHISMQPHIINFSGKNHSALEKH